jgi:hypothetical protein
MFQRLARFAETKHEARLDFSESVEVVTSRMRELSGSRLPVGRGMIPRSQVMLDADELRVLDFGRTLLCGRVESQPHGSSLVLTATAPLLRVGACLWWLAVAHGVYALLVGFVLSGRMEFEFLAECFLLASFVGSMLFPSLWGRRWRFCRIVAVLGEQLQAQNNAEWRAAGDAASLARGGAWSSFLSAFVWSPFLAIQRFPVPFSGSESLSAPWNNWRMFLEQSLTIEVTLLLLMLLFGWMFVVGGVVSAEFVRRFTPSQSPTRRRWIVVVLSLGVSLALCWLISGSNVLARMFYIP